MLVHHARKSAGRVRAGQALRGSSELHAWGDSNLYLRRAGDRLHLSIEHRAAQAPDPLALELAHGRALRVVDSPSTPQDDPTRPPAAHPAQRILDALAEANQPLSRQALRVRCRMRTATLGTFLQRLTEQHRIVRREGGYILPPAAP